MTEDRSSLGSPMPWALVQGAAVLVVLAFFLWALREVLNPFLLFLVLVAVLLPFRGMPGRALLLVVASGLTLVWALSTSGTLLAPFLIAAGLAYLLDPLVDRLETRGLGRTLAILLLALPVAGLLAVAVLVGVPALAAQLGDLIDQAPVLLVSLRDNLRGVPLVGDELIARLQELDAEQVVSMLQERQAVLAERAWGGVVGVGRGLGSAFTLLGYTVLTPVLTFYLLRDWDRVTEAAANLVPTGRRDSFVSFAREYDRLLARYLRGQVLVALTIGAVTVLGLWVARFPYALLIGFFVSVFSVVPYLGLLLSLIPAVIVALVSGAIGVSLLKVAIVFGVAQGLEGAVVSPRIVGDSVGLHPVWVVLALAAAGFYFGFVGLLLAVPGAVGVKLMVVRGLARYRESRLYQGEPAD